MNELFDICVTIIQTLADVCGISYEAMNIWLFVIIHPILTLILAIMAINYRRRWKRAVRGNIKPEVI